MSTVHVPSKVNSRQELSELREKFKGNTLMRIISDESENRTEINVAMATCGIKAGARDILKVIFDEVNKERLEDVSVLAVDCMGQCDCEPMVEVLVPGKSSIVYQNVTSELAKEIVQKLK